MVWALQASTSEFAHAGFQDRSPTVLMDCCSGPSDHICINRLPASTVFLECYVQDNTCVDCRTHGNCIWSPCARPAPDILNPACRKRHRNDTAASFSNGHHDACARRVRDLSSLFLDNQGGPIAALLVMKNWAECFFMAFVPEGCRDY